ncbi:purine-nucleoside phosphorylase [Roseimaritima sediminicola]|uniref:purine-nucleoside phosphorylase n=1 Tax=Roseimaritima sediminicola TaxID=2662066 RepID=UPI001386A78B|nr:purine-nucleoside phosphorylase [Roseimaritima sediminicola]
MNLDSTLSVITARTDLRPRFGIVLGSGLGGLADAICSPVVIPFSDLPGFGTSTAGGHRSQLVLGYLADTPVVALAGRLHRYGGWSTDQVTLPVRVMQALGAEKLIVSNAAGGVNPKLCVGDIVVIHDHVDWMYGLPTARFGCASPDWDLDTVSRCEAVYDSRLSAHAFGAGRRGGFAVHPGTYLGTLGPNYETRAEYRMMRRLGADVVGMSTVPEVMTAARLGMRVLALSMVSNVACPDVRHVASHDEVLAAGRNAEPRMGQIVQTVIAAEQDG